MLFQAPLSGSRSAHISTVFPALELLVCLPHGKQKKNPPFNKSQKKLADSAHHAIVNDRIFLLIANMANIGEPMPAVRRSWRKMPVRAWREPKRF
jgi:hypothetical protein